MGIRGQRPHCEWPTPRSTLHVALETDSQRILRQRSEDDECTWVCCPLARAGGREDNRGCKWAIKLVLDIV